MFSLGFADTSFVDFMWKVQAQTWFIPLERYPVWLWCLASSSHWHCEKQSGPNKTAKVKLRNHFYYNNKTGQIKMGLGLKCSRLFYNFKKRRTRDNKFCPFPKDWS